MSRREFLGGAVLAAGVLAGGCAGELAPAAPADADVLAPLLAGELAAVALLRSAPDATGIRDQDRGHVARLRTALEGLGAGRAAAPGGGPADGGDPAPLRKQQNVYDYVAALPGLADPDLRVMVMELLASEAGHLAALRLAAGEDPVPDAFAGFTPPAT